MSSLKDKFDDFREEPQIVTWQTLLKRLDAEMPVKKKRKYLLWLLPLIVIGSAASWWMISDNQTPLASTFKSASVAITPERTVCVRAYTALINSPDVSSESISVPLIAKKSAFITYSEPITPAPVTKQSENSLSSLDPININIPNPVYTFKTESKFDLLLPVGRTEDSIVSNPEDIKKTDSLKVDSTKLAIKPPAKPENNFLLQIYYAPGVSNIFLRNPLLPLFNSKNIAENKALRKSISKTGFSFTTGFGIKMNLNNGFRAQSGFYFTQVNQTLYYNAQPSQCNCPTITLSTLDPNINESKMSNLTDTISQGNKYTANNKFSLQEIPLLFEYEMPMPKHRNFNTVINFGISYMYMRGVNTQMPDADNVGFVNIINKTANPSIFPSYKDAFNAILGYGIIYNAKRNVEWSLAPQFKIAFTSLSKDTHWFREYPWQFHLGIGVGKRF